MKHDSIWETALRASAFAEESCVLARCPKERRQRDGGEDPDDQDDDEKLGQSSRGGVHFMGAIGVTHALLNAATCAS